jgi:hypothetical protein
MSRTIYLNEDNHCFYGCRPPEQMTEAGINALVDTYAEGTQIGGLLFCVNVQRALFDSQVWEHLWDDYDPALGEDQPALRRGHGVKNHLLLRQRGLDQHRLWLARCRHHGIEGWLTMRMNDCHGLKEYQLWRAAGSPPPGDWTVHWPSTFWRRHPEYWRAPYRLERSWEAAFDFAHQAVRDYHLALVREVLERYDMYGLELDWMRWGMFFAPGYEAAGRPLLTEFVRTVRRYADAAAARLGHPVRLAHRLPAQPESCLALGFDPITWAREGLADLVTISTFCGGANFDYPVELWRAMLGPRVKLLAVADASAQPYPQRFVEEYEILYGSAAAALQRGVDGVYLFNQNYRGTDEPELLAHMLRHLGSLGTLATCRRRHPICYPQANAPGGPTYTVLPIPLLLPKIGTDFGRMEENITLRLATGPRPRTGRAVLVLGFGGGVPAGACANLPVRLNTQPVAPCPEPDYDSISTGFRRFPRHGWGSDFIAETHCFALPLDRLHDDVNVIEFIPPQVAGTLEWAEIVILPQP